MTVTRTPTATRPFLPPAAGIDVESALRNGSNRPVVKRYRDRHHKPPAHKQGLSTGMAWALVAVCTAASLGLSLHDLSARSLWLDEGYTWIYTSTPLSDLWQVVRQQGGHLVAYYLFVHLMISWFGDSSLVLRLPSAIMGALAVPVVYLAACRIAKDRVAGVFAAALFVVSEPLVYYQQTARDYGLVVLLAATTSLLITAATETGRIRTLVAWGLVTALSCYTHPELMFLVPFQLVVYLVWARSRVLKIGVVILLLLVLGGAYPAVHYASFSPAYSTTYVGPPNLKAAEGIATFLASGGAVGRVTPVNHALLVVTAVVWVIGLVQVIRLFVIRRPRQALGPTLVILWLVGPPFLAWVVSQTGRPDFLDRYMIDSLPAAAILLAMVLARIRPRVVGFLALSYVLAFRFGVMAPTYGIPLDDFAKGTSAVLSSAQPHDCITFDDSQIRVDYDYYASRYHPKSGGTPRLPTQVMPPASNDLRPASVFAALTMPPRRITNWQSEVGVWYTAKSCPRLWVFVSHVGGPTGTPGNRALWARYQQFQRAIRGYYAPRGITHVPNVTVILYQRVRVTAKP